MLRDMPRNPLLLQILSLYLLLLAFFVVLNTISRVEAVRLQAVSGSLNATFSSDGIPVDRADRFTSNEGEVLGDAGFMGRLGSLIRTELAVVKVSEPVPGRLLEVAFPQNELFVPDRSAIITARRTLIDDLASAVRAASPEWRYEIEILVGAEPGNALAIARAAILAKRLVAAGVQKRGVLAGVVRGDPASLRLRFQLRPRKEETYSFFGKARP